MCLQVRILQYTLKNKQKYIVTLSCLTQHGNEYLNPGKDRACSSFISWCYVYTQISDPVWDFEEVGDSMLHYVNTSLEYGNAKMWCQGLGAQLVEFWTEQEYRDVSAQF